MALTRVLEVEVMDTAAEAADYNSMDHSAVNTLFTRDLLYALASGGRQPPDISETPLQVLDLGTGTALIPIELCRRTSQCRVLAVDLATHMLDLARKNVANAGFGNRIQLEQIDAKVLPFADGLFDVVISNSIIHHIPEPMHSLQEAVRVTKPGGLLFFRDLLRPADEATLTLLVQTYAGGENAHSRQMFDDSLHAALSLDEIRGLVTQLGFSPESVQQTSDRHWTFVGRPS
ncbi:MAG: class I SAM-dependent methyltransferase [Planctomycetales bacterium]|nr:class I SAM-dependent methyltransferase [Planctomycetales bacterium]